MTDQTLAKANKLKGNIDALVLKKGQLEDVYTMMNFENTSSVLEREYRVEIKTERDTALIFISPNSIALAIMAEIESATKEIEELQREFLELH